MDNIFKNAKFGDKFRMRNGKLAVYAYEELIGAPCHVLIINEGHDSTTYREDGYSLHKDFPQEIDIISKWEE